MTEVIDGQIRLPFSDVVLARSLTELGAPATEALQAAARVGGRIDKMDAIPTDALRSLVQEDLRESGLGEVERRLRVRHWFRTAKQPFVIFIGGSSGTGKSTVSEAVAAKLGIGGVVSTDLVRAVMRSVLNDKAVPTLFESTFTAEQLFRSNISGNRLLAAFEQQSRIVQAGTAALVDRAIKEGLKIVVNGAHLVSGLVEIPDEWPFFDCILYIPDRSDHATRFGARVEGSQRGSERYVERMNAIHDLEDYIVSMCREAGTSIVANSDFDACVDEIVRQVCAFVESEYGV
jgi:2-phosphoglycerate kinase